MWSIDERRERRPRPEREGGTGEGAPDAAEWVRTRLCLQVDAMQARVLQTDTKRGILNCCRQWGKSTITAAKALHEGMHEAGSLTVVVSPSARQSSEFLRKASEFARRLGIQPKGDGDNEISMQLPNRSRIVGLPGTEMTVRGFSAVSLLLVDEAARVSDELYAAVRPMLAVSDGALWLMSTPWSKRGFFYETWANGGREWERFRAPANECARIKREFLEEELATIGERRFGREYLCEFDDTLSGVFERELVERAITDEIKPLMIR